MAFHVEQLEPKKPVPRGTISKIKIRKDYQLEVKSYYENLRHIKRTDKFLAG